jgi:hypothetical protein
VRIRTGAEREQRDDATAECDLAELVHVGSFTSGVIKAITPTRRRMADVYSANRAVE